MELYLSLSMCYHLVDAMHYKLKDCGITQLGV